MRLVSTAALLCAVSAAPALAQSRDQAEAATRALQNPVVQEGLAGVVSQIAGIVLDTKVGPLAHYADPEDDIRATDTLRDIERRRDPGFEQRLHDDSRRAVAVTGVAAQDALAMSASLEDTAARLRAALAPLRQAIAGYDDK